MKILREKAPFRPINIVLETTDEAERFLAIIDKIDAKHRNSNPPPDITKDEYQLIIKISDAFTNMVGFRD
jgi:hypothetical protein